MYAAACKERQFGLATISARNLCVSLFSWIFYTVGRVEDACFVAMNGEPALLCMLPARPGSAPLHRRDGVRFCNLVQYFHMRLSGKRLIVYVGVSNGLGEASKQ